METILLGQVQPSGKRASMSFCLTIGLIIQVTNNYTADVTDNNYYMYKQGLASPLSLRCRRNTDRCDVDISRIAALGVKAYSFSISWSRIFPFGRGAVNEEAIAHYNDVINTCIEYNVIPMITLYHWDTPLALQDTYGGWLSERIVHDFVEYARIAYGRFGDRVKYWFTVNERKMGIMTLSLLAC